MLGLVQSGSHFGRFARENHPRTRRVHARAHGKSSLTAYVGSKLFCCADRFNQCALLFASIKIPALHRSDEYSGLAVPQFAVMLITAMVGIRMSV